MIEAFASYDPQRYVPAVFSRAPYFIVHIGGRPKYYIKNPYKDYSSSVAKRVINMLKAKGVEVVYAKEFGPKAQYWLRQNRMRFEVRK